MDLLKRQTLIGKIWRVIGILCMIPILSLLFLLIVPIDYDKMIYHDLGAGYVYAPWDEAGPSHKEELSFTEFSVKNDSLTRFRNKECTKFDRIFVRVPHDSYITKVRYNNDYIVLKSVLRDNQKIYYWIIFKKTDAILGPLDSEEAKKISRLQNNTLRILVSDL